MEKLLCTKGKVRAPFIINEWSCAVSGDRGRCVTVAVAGCVAR